MELTRGGPRGGGPEPERVRAMSSGSRMKSTIFMGPPQAGQTVTSTWKTLASILAQDVRPELGFERGFFGLMPSMGKTS